MGAGEVKNYTPLHTVKPEPPETGSVAIALVCLIGLNLIASMQCHIDAVNCAKGAPTNY